MPFTSIFKALVYTKQLTMMCMAAHVFDIDICKLTEFLLAFVSFFLSWYFQLIDKATFE